MWVFGELIHNSHVINMLEELGIETLETIPENNGGICVIRSHGMAPQLIDKIAGRGFDVVDLTCPDVKKVQQKAVELAKEGFLVIILGKPEHPEVIAIKANAEQFSKNVSVISDISDLKKIEQEILKQKKVGVVIQTTQKIEFLQEILYELIPVVSELKVFNTICRSTSLRQQEAKELAKSSDLMLVVGSKKSANTTHLAEILKDITNTIHIEVASDLENYSGMLIKSKNIGITAGASTPDDVINDVLNYLKSI